MSLQYFKPNAKNSGSACNFAFNVSDDCIYVNLIKQVAWNNNKGVFKGGKRLVTKLNSNEVGGLLCCLEKNQDQSFIHKTENGMTSIFFQKLFKWDAEKKEYGKDQVGYYLSVTRNPKEGEKETLRIGFNYGESTTLREYLKWGLGLLFAERTFNRPVKESKIKEAKVVEKPEPKQTPKQQLEPELVGTGIESNVESNTESNSDDFNLE
ncbi:MAG: hypothetical protein AABY22_05405 [Nanoarchaeota archaeon]